MKKNIIILLILSTTSLYLYAGKNKKNKNTVFNKNAPAQEIIQIPSEFPHVSDYYQSSRLKYLDFISVINAFLKPYLFLKPKIVIAGSHHKIEFGIKNIKSAGFKAHGNKEELYPNRINKILDDLHTAIHIGLAEYRKTLNNS